VVEKAGIIYVVGDVRQPSGFVMENADLTVLQAVAMAQGTNPTAALNSASIIRRSATGEKQQIPVELGNILTAKGEDVRLQPDDIVFVPVSAAKSIGRRTMEAVIQAATGVAIYGRR
jgi:polysaccharide export outer membrane protein